MAGGISLEKYLVEHCAPTLAGLKTASMFCLPLEGEADWRGQAAHWNAVLNPKGLFLLILRRRADRALLYLCRPSQLQRDLDCPGVEELLSRYGYQNARAEEALARLRLRLEQEDGFPHEIGLFLGYPLGDVEGFIQNEGKNCKCCGCWKVYGDELEARRRFARMEKCRQVYARLWSQGRSLWQLTVAA